MTTNETQTIIEKETKIMTVMDLYKVLTVNQKVIIKDFGKNWSILYKGAAGYIPHYTFDNNVKWIYASDESDCTLEIII